MRASVTDAFSREYHSILFRPYALLLLFAALFLLQFVGSAQAIYLPTSHEVYPFLKRMEARQLLTNYRDAATPLSRRLIAKKLSELTAVQDSMTRVERSEFEFLKEEFNYELSSLAGDPEPSEIRWHILSQPLDHGIMNFDLDYRYEERGEGADHSALRSQGLKLYGYVFDDVGFYFNWVDNRHRGSGLNKQGILTPDPGEVLAKDLGDVIEYNDLDVQFTFHFGKFEFALEKMKNIWGFGQRGNVIFSTKPPSYPQFQMRVPLSDKIDFVYFHAELNSNVLDSVRSYYTFSSRLADVYRPVDRVKFLAAHQLEFTLWKGVDFSIGESVVYSDRGPILAYLIPISFFKAIEHYNGDTDNAQIFGSLDLNVFRNVNMYCSLFIDELNTDDFFDPNKSRKQVAFTTGFKTFDLPFENLEFITEYSRMNPWVYSHKFTAANFTNASHDLGHWVGQNGDDLYFDLSYSPSRALKIGGFSEVLRKGDKEDVSYQYLQDYSPDFLYSQGLDGSVFYHEERSFGLYGRYEPVRDVSVDFRVRNVNYKHEEQAAPALQKIQYEKSQFEFRVGANLGVW